MMENKKKISFLIIAISLIMIAIVVWLVIKNKDQGLVPPIVDNQGSQIATITEPINTSTPGTAPRDYRKFDISKEPKIEQDEEAVKKIAMSFAERFGSFSNQSNYSNIEDLKIFMTKSMGNWAEGYLSDLKEAKSNNGEYYGITTKAVSAEAKSFDKNKGEAEIVITTRRQESKGSVVGAYFNQELTLKMAKDGSIWKADSASWQK
ncbi:MAG: hypothetical protein PHR57_01330 [Patescibacteria group bacterium]|nr:hypothetical protein [Patescibacteria group bacterium]